MPSNRLDTYLGAELRAWLDAAAAASGQRPAAIIQSALRDYRLAQGDLADQVRRQVLALAAAVEPDERYDPEDDPRLAAALAPLAQLLGSLAAAEGVASALQDLWTRWALSRQANRLS